MTETTITLSDFQATLDKVSNWGKWGKDDQLGTLNYLTADRVAAARSAIVDGTVVSGANDITSAARADSPNPPQLVPFWSRMGDLSVGGDTLSLSAHGWNVTHLDSLSHVYWKGKMYNGVELNPFRSADQTINSIMTGKNGISGRGVLLDLARIQGKDFMEPGEFATVEDLEKCLEAQKCEILPGDIVYFRTGKWGRELVKGVAAPAEGLQGVSAHAIEWAHEKQISLFVCDGGMDPQPSEVEGCRIPWHVATLVYMGAMLVDNANLEEMAKTCEEKKRWTFFTSIAPLRVKGGNSSPVNPIAVF